MVLCTGNLGIPMEEVDSKLGEVICDDLVQNASVDYKVSNFFQKAPIFRSFYF